MKKDKHETRVIFRVWRPVAGGSNEVIAFFPEIDEGRGMCSSYMHTGQHAPADYLGLRAHTELAAPEEYASLARELEGLGYRLKIRSRR